jgi:hypothetical protein
VTGDCRSEAGTGREHAARVERWIDGAVGYARQSAFHNRLT